MLTISESFYPNSCQIPMIISGEVQRNPIPDMSLKASSKVRQQQHQTPQHGRQWRQRIASIGVAGCQQPVSTVAVCLPGP